MDGPKGEPGPFGASTEGELVDYLIRKLKDDVAANLRIESVDGENHKIGVDAYAVTQAVDILKKYKTLIGKDV